MQIAINAYASIRIQHKSSNLQHIAFEPNTISPSAVNSPVNGEGYANFTISLANYLGV